MFAKTKLYAKSLVCCFAIELTCVHNRRRICYAFPSVIIRNPRGSDSDSISRITYAEMKLRPKSAANHMFRGQAAEWRLWHSNLLCFSIY